MVGNLDAKIWKDVDPIATDQAHAFAHTQCRENASDRLRWCEPGDEKRAEIPPKPVALQCRGHATDARPLLVHRDLVPGFRQHRRRREAADTGADDRRLHVGTTVGAFIAREIKDAGCEVQPTG